MPGWHALPLLLFLVSALLAGCRDQDAASAPKRSGLTGGGVFQVSYRPTPDPIPLNQHFSVDVIVQTLSGNEPPEGIEIRIDGVMPAHGHGMNVKPEIVAVAPGRYRADGMLFHMPGEWRLIVELVTDAVVDRIEFAVVLDAG